MNRSTSSVSGKTKFKIVFLGDQNTGKTSIIERFINDKFNPESTVRKLLLSRRLELTSSGATSTIRISTTDYSCGIQPGRNDTVVSSQVTLRTLFVPFMSSICQVYGFSRRS